MSVNTATKKPGKLLRRHNISGGIQPTLNKTSALRSRIMPMPLPPTLSVPLHQYQGEPAKPVVTTGTTVRKYQLLAKPLSARGVPVHAPTSGVVTAIAESPIAGLPGSSALCIEIRCDGEDTAIALQATPDFHTLSAEALQEKIQQAGVVGMGGAGYPTAHKLRLAAERGIELLIINAAECEPYISTDEALLREYATQVVTGAEILRAASHAPRCIIAIERDKLDAIAALDTALAHSPVELVLLPTVYPTGSEKQLVQAVTGLEVPAGKYPLDIGILVHNVGTAYACYQAVIEGMPSISRVTTLTGNALKTPKNFFALLGTSVAFLLQLCGIDKTRHQTTILGGSLMGIELESVDVPIAKTSNCLIAAAADEFAPSQPELACIRCGYCAQACPARLLPQQLYNFARTHNHAQLHNYGLNDCIECGACAYVCPSHIPLVQYYLAAKQEIAETLILSDVSDYWQSRFQFHQYRLKKEKEQAQSKPRRSIVAKPDNAATGEASFSRTQARQEIADAVARAKAKAKMKKAAAPDAPPTSARSPKDSD